MNNNKSTTLIFDWGDTIMCDFDLPGPMMNWEKVAWISGAEESLKVLCQKFTCIIATSAGQSGTPEMIAALKRVGADQYFHHFVSSKDLGYDKPDPRFFLAVAEKFGKKPGDCIMIGNLYEKDIVGAKKAGMRTIFFNEKMLEGSFPDADFIIFEMNELLNYIS